MPFIAEFRSDCAACYEPLEPGQKGRVTPYGPAHFRCPSAAPEEARAACPRCHLIHAPTQEECD